MKAKNLFIIIFISIQFTILAQEETKEHEWEIGIHFSPDYAYRSLSYQAGNNLSSFLLNKRDSLEVSDFRFTTGLSFRYRLSKRFFWKRVFIILLKAFKHNGLIHLFLCKLLTHLSQKNLKQEINSTT